MSAEATRGAAVPYWRLSGFYFFYFATVGALLPYWGVYLKRLGFDSAAIGELLAILVGTRIVAPNVWGWIADHRSHRMAIVRLATLLSCVAFAGVFFAHGFLPLALVMLSFGFFWSAALPQFEATTLNHLGDSVNAYTRVRLWGSIGFIATVWALGALMERSGIGLLPPVVFVLMIGIWLMSTLVPEQAAGHLPLAHSPLRSVLSRAPVIALLAACFLMQAAHGAYYAFYSIYVEAHGYASATVGALWALGVIAEVAVFLVMHRLLHRFGLRRLLLASFLLGVVRWLLIAWYVDVLPLLLIAQVLHAATFGVYHATAIQLIHRYFTGRNQGRGQALYSSLSFGAGGALGTLLGGYSWGSLGSTLTYTGSALVCALGFVIVWRWVGD